METSKNRVQDLLGYSLGLSFLDFKQTLAQRDVVQGGAEAVSYI
jgi:hypothetical protein